MGYTNHPTRVDKSVDDLTDEEALEETIVRVIYDALVMKLDPMSSMQEHMLGGMIVTVLEHLLGEEQFETYVDDARQYGLYAAKQAAANQGMDVTQMLEEMGVPSDLIEKLNEDIDPKFQA